MTPTGINPDSKFALVHKLAKEERLRRHAAGCRMCQTFPDRCLFRQQILQIMRACERNN